MGAARYHAGMVFDPRSGLSHVRAPSPIRFPVEETVPESKRHLELRTMLYTVLKTFADRHSIGCDQFVYWSASDPKRCLAPDGFVRLGTPDGDFDSWKTWERGAPELCIEIVSEFDASLRSWEKKLARYHELGAAEVVRFDPDAPEGKRLRVWDRLEGDLVERIVEADRTPCLTLGLFWVVGAGAGYPAAPRLARDPEGRDLFPTPAEAHAAESRAREAETRAREAETRAREAAEQRVRELEEELRRRGG
jgi:Uma2 family endonuclease